MESATTTVADINLRRIESETKYMLWRVSQLYNYKSQNTDDYMGHVKALYAMVKNLRNILKSHTTNNDEHYNFLQYIHQAMLYDFIYMEMNETVGETPEYYKSKAKKRLTLPMLRDFQTTAVAEKGYPITTEDIQQYLDLNYYSPPWDSHYFKDVDNIYCKTKSHFYELFNVPSLNSDTYYNNILPSEENNINYYIENFKPL